MMVSILMNLINIVGNILGIFVFHADILGVAVASPIARAVAAAIMVALARNQKNSVFVRFRELFSWRWDMVKRILHIAVPNGVENGLFQFSKLILVRIIALFGTAQIAANGVANSIDYVGAIIVSAMSLAIVTVVGQCVGAGDYDQAKYYIRKLLKVSYVSSIILDLAIIALCPLILNLYQLSEEASRIAFFLVVIHNAFIFTVFPLSGPLSSAMRAAGDVKYTMLVSIFATVVCRVILSLIFGVWMNLGIIGIWIAMGLDWTIRAALLVIRYRSGKWKEFRMV